MKHSNARWTVLAAVCLAALAAPAIQAGSVAIAPNQDGSLYENFGDNEANGAGEWLFSGRSNCCNSRRALLSFDIAASVPAGATVTGVSLSLNASLVAPTSGPRAHALHAVASAWGEGTSNAFAPGGFGATATPGDTTWAHTFFPTDFWTTPGGDFAAAASATTVVDGVGSYTWTSAGMIADVQAWLDAPAANFGWILIGDETANGTAKRFGSRENLDPPQRPMLTVDFIEAGFCGDGSPDPGEECDDGNNVDGDGCQGNCLLPVCGDNIVDAGEQCDDGNTTDGDGCQGNCQSPICGDGILDTGESCDDGNTENEDACRNDCTINPSVSIPTVSEWGVILMALMLVALGTWVFGRRRLLPSGE